MKVLRKRTEELKRAIIQNPSLLNDLSHTIEKVIGKKIQIPENTTYVFVPRVYSKPVFWPEVYAVAQPLERIPFGGAGPMDPQIAVILDKNRLEHYAMKDPTPEPALLRLREEILKNPDLFMALSKEMASVLANHNVTFNTDETFAFIPVAVKKPIFAGDIAAATPQPDPPTILVLANADMSRWEVHQAKDFAVEFDPGTIIDGIPAPEILVFLEKQRIS